MKHAKKKNSMIKFPKCLTEFTGLDGSEENTLRSVKPIKIKMSNNPVPGIGMTRDDKMQYFGELGPNGEREGCGMMIMTCGETYTG